LQKLDITDKRKSDSGDRFGPKVKKCRFWDITATLEFTTI